MINQNVIIACFRPTDPKTSITLPHLPHKIAEFFFLRRVALGRLIMRLQHATPAKHTKPHIIERKKNIPMHGWCAVQIHLVNGHLGQTLNTNFQSH